MLIFIKRKKVIYELQSGWLSYSIICCTNVELNRIWRFFLRKKIWIQYFTNLKIIFIKHIYLLPQVITAKNLKINMFNN